MGRPAEKNRIMQPVAAKYLTVPLEDKGLRQGQGTKGKYIGLYGGSFNPPHEGHVLVAEAALRRLKLDAVWWLVSPGNPMKDISGLAPLAGRIAASEALLDNPHIQVTAFEETLAMHNSAEMLQCLVHANPQTHFVWIMGADNLENFHLWQDWRLIMQTLPIAVVNRPHFGKADKAPAAQEFAAARLDEKDAAKLAGHKAPAWLFIHGQRSGLSSTMLRERQKMPAKQKAT